MKIVNIIEGLGNQMFQYAFALAWQRRCPASQVKIDIKNFKGYDKHPGGYELDRIFNPELEKASQGEIIKLNLPSLNFNFWGRRNRVARFFPTVLLEKKSMVFEPKALEDANNRYYDGFWQSERYFIDQEDAVREAFRFPEFDDEPNLSASQLAKEGKSASIHVRRGDYLELPQFNGICTLDYYRKAIAKLDSLAEVESFLVFSNDTEWCKENLKDLFGKRAVCFVSWNKGAASYRDMQLMSCCKHNILANSSFSWWGAWLNPNPDKVVIAPSRWKNVPYPLDIIPESWIKISI